MKTGQYYVFVPHLSRDGSLIPNSHHIYVNDGALMIFDSDDNIIQIFAPGKWIMVMNREQFEAYREQEK